MGNTFQSSTLTDYWLSDLCTRNKKVFTHEHDLFTPGELRKHERFGDDHPGDVDQSGFRGHPECGFCKQRFYGDDELYAHCRDKHEKCHICERRNQARDTQYYVDYNALEIHFRDAHFLCLDKECLEKKFVVFESEMDLKAHQLEAHPQGLSKDARRDARRIDMSNFDYRPNQMEIRASHRGGRGRGRGRDPNAEPIPASSAQPLRRDELAYQRQIAIQSAQSVSSRTFGGQLTAAGGAPARTPQNPSSQGQGATTSAGRRAEGASMPLPLLGSLRLEAGSNSDAGTSSPNLDQVSMAQEQARRIRHTSVMERARNLLKDDTAKFEQFRARISSFQKSSTSASELIESFFTLFDTSATELGKLIKELADLYENESKRNDLLKAWNDRRAINENYPALPAPVDSVSTSSNPFNSGGRRVLRLKSSTAQSSRSEVSRQRSWGSAASSSNPFPPVDQGAASSASRLNMAREGTPQWGRSSAVANSATSTQPSSRSRAPGASNVTSAEAFPALPAAAKPTSTIFGYGTGAVRRDVGRSTAVNVWSNGTSSDANAINEASNSAAELEEEGKGKKKGKGNKKMTLYQWG